MLVNELIQQACIEQLLLSDTVLSARNTEIIRTDPVFPSSLESGGGVGTATETNPWRPVVNPGISMAGFYGTQGKRSLTSGGGKSG